MNKIEQKTRGTSKSYEHKLKEKGSNKQKSRLRNEMVNG